MALATLNKKELSPEEQRLKKSYEDKIRIAERAHEDRIKNESDCIIMDGGNGPTFPCFAAQEYLSNRLVTGKDAGVVKTSVSHPARIRCL